MTVQHMTADSLRQRARTRSRVNYFDDFQVGQTFEHHWGRTVTDSDNALFSSLTLHYSPLYLNTEYARQQGHPGTVVNPYLVFLTVFGMSVEDLSEAGGAFLGVEELSFREPVYPGDTLTARSTVTSLRGSSSRPEGGIATWHTEGLDQHGSVVIDFLRTNLINRRAEGHS